MKSTSFVMNFVMLAIFVTFVAIASQYPPQARFMPFVVGIPSIGLCLLQIFLDIRASRRKVVEVEDSRSEATATPGTPEVMDASSIPPGMVGREILMWTYFLGFIASVLVFGFWFTIPIFLVTFLHFEAKLTWLKAVLTGVIATGILYLAVAKGLRVDLHPGFVTEYLFDL